MMATTNEMICCDSCDASSLPGFTPVTKRYRKAVSNRQVIAKSLIKHTVASKLRILNQIKNFPDYPEFFGLTEITESDLKYINYLIAVLIRRRNDAKKSYVVRVEKRKERAEWWLESGRTAAYRRNHPFGELSHDWLNYKICRITKMQTGDGFDRSSDEEVQCCDMDCIYRLKRLGMPGICLEDPAPPMRQRKREVPLKKWDKKSFVFTPDLPPRPRDKILLLKLKVKIQLLREKRARKQGGQLPKEDFQRAFIKRVFKQIPKSTAYHQGIDETDGAHGDSSGLIVDQASNVALTRQSDESEAKPESVDNRNTFNLATSDQHPQYDAFMDRYLLLDTISWKTTQTQGEELSSYSLPFHIVNKRGKSPNMAFFKLYQYVKCDMEIKVQVNAQPMAQGQLQVSWKYMDDFDQNAKWYNNIQSLSQTDHVLITANDENPGTIYIPYRYVKPSMSTTVRSDQDKPLRMGVLRVKVMNPLYTSATSCGDVDVSIWVRFLNGQFSGMTSRDVGSLKDEHQGLWEDIKDAEFHLNIDAKLHNKDKPPVQNASQQVIVNSNQSYSAGLNSTEPINALRLDMRGQGQNVENCNQDTSISKVARVFGFVRTVKWHVCDTTTKLLTTIDASPMFNLNEYAQGVEQTDRFFNLPPVAVLSEMFLYWRGSLELRIDAIATAFHKGKLMVCYVPRVIENITMEQALGCPHVIFDLSQQKQFSFTVPWITNQHYWSRRFGVREFSDQVQPPGKIYIFIQNKLSKQDNVKDTVDLNLYWRGGPDFSVAVPATSALSLPWNPAKSSSGSLFRAGPGYSPFYIGAWRYFYGNRPILRYGTGADHISQFINVPSDISNVYFKYNQDDGKIGCFNSDGTWSDYTHGVILADGDYRYMVMCRTEDEAKMYLNYQKFSAYKHNAADALAVIRDDDKGNWGGKNNLTWEQITYEPVPPPTENKADEYVMIALAQHQGEKDSVEAPSINLATSNVFVENASQQTFGENFSDLKDLCRRYQPYTPISLRTNRYAAPVDKIMPIAPCGLSLGSIDGAVPADRYKFLKREGHIPIICSGYRFFRGGLRFRLPVAHSEAQIFMTHLPEKQGLSNIIKPVDDSFDAYYSPTYATYVQSTHVNPVISIEIPYYNVNNSIFPNQLNQASLKEMRGLLDLGALAIGASSQIEHVADTSGILFYSFADDAMLSCFQGFPSMILRSENFKKDFVQHQGFMDWFNFTPKIKVDLGVQEILDSPQFKQLNETMQTFGITTTQALMNQIIHVAINPTSKTIAWAMVSMLIQTKLFTFEYFSKLVPLFEKLTFKIQSFGLFGPDANPNQPDQQRGLDNANHQAFSDDTITEIGQIVATLFSLLLIVVNVPNIKNPKSFTKYVAVLLGGVAAGAKHYQSILALFINLLKVFKKFGEYISYWLHPELVMEKLAHEELPILQLWTEEVTKLLNIENEDKVYTQGSVWAERMEVAYTLGCRIQKHIVDYKGDILPPAQLRLFTTLFKQLCEKRDQMYRRGRSVVARKDPFCIYIAGDPGIGKSIMATKLTTSLLREAGIPVVGEPIFTLPNGAKYWNGCRNQPAILIDDFLCVNSGTIQEEAIRAFFEIKSAAILNPPMASLTEKDLRYAPQLVTVLSNSTFPVVNHANLEAIYRRRDILVKVNLIPRMRDAGLIRLSGQTKAELEAQFNVDMLNFEHLEFYMAADVTGGIAHGGNATEEGAQFLGPYTYREFFRRALRTLEDHEETQEALYQMRVEDLDAFLEEDIDDAASLGEKLEEFRRIIRFMGELPVRQNANYKDYLRLIQMVANNEPVTEARFREVVEIRERTMQNFRQIQEQQRQAQQQNINQEQFADEEIAEGDHQGPMLWSGAFSQKDLEKGIKHNINYCLHNDVAHYSKEVGIKVNCKGREKIKYVKVHTALKYQAAIELLQHRFQLLKTVNITVNTGNVTTLILHTNEVPTYQKFNEMKVQLNQELERQALVPYVPNHVVNAQTLNPENFEDEMHNVLLHAFNQTFCYDRYRENLRNTFNACWLNPEYVHPNLDKIMKYISCDMGHGQFNRFMHLSNLYLYKFCDTEEAFNKIFIFDRLRIKKTWAQLSGLAMVWIFINCFNQHYFDELFEEGEAGAITMDVKEVCDKYVKILKILTDSRCMSYSEPEVGTIMRGFYENSESVRNCCHIYFTPMSTWDGTNWATPISTIAGTEIKLIPEECCESYFCLWRRDHIKRYHAQLWKANNKSSFNIILSSPNKPKLFTDPKSIDPTFFEDIKMRFAKGWFWFKVLATVAAHVIFCILVVLVPIIIFLVRVYLLYRSIRHVFRGEEFFPRSNQMPTTAPTSESFNSFHESYSQDTPSGQFKNHYQNFFNKPGQHQGVGNSTLTKRILQNTYWVQDVNGGSQFRITCLGGTTFIFLKHFWEYFVARGTTSLKFDCCGSVVSHVVPIDKIKFIFNNHNSGGIAIVKEGVPLHKHIYRRFQPLRNIKKTPKQAIFLEIDYQMANTTTVNLCRHPGVVVAEQGAFSEQILSDIYKYDYGGSGKCGSFLIDPINDVILGVHVAGRDNIGYAEVYCIDSFLSLFTNPESQVEPPEIECVKSDGRRPPVKGSFIYHGQVQDGLQHHQSGATQIQKTLIHGVTPVSRAPAPLAKGDSRVPIEDYSPLWAGVEKMMQPTQDFPCEVLDRAAEDLKTQIMTKLEPIYLPIAPLTYMEAIKGIDGLQYYDSLDFTTSEGFPLARMRPSDASNKSWLFDRSRENEIGIHEHLQQLLDHEMENRLNNKCNLVVHDDCLKDALIDATKIPKPGKTRIFSVSPVQFTIVFKQFFTHFLAAFKSQRIKFEHAIGIPVNGLEWAMVVRYLKSNGAEKVITGDYSNFGPALNSSCVNRAFDIIISWLDKYYGGNATYLRVMRVMKHELVYSYHLAMGTLYQVQCGLPSGNPATVELNSMVNMLYIRCAWIEIMKNASGYRYFMDHYYIHVRLLTYGDDLIMSVTDEVAEYFNSKTLQNYFAKYDIVYTDATKSGDVRPWGTLAESQFLKRGFIAHPTLPDQWLAPLDWASVQDTPNWCKRYLSLEEGTKESACAALSEAYGHGPEKYTELRTKLLEALTQAGITCSLRTWYDWDSIHFSKYYS